MSLGQPDHQLIDASSIPVHNTFKRRRTERNPLSDQDLEDLAFRDWVAGLKCHPQTSWKLSTGMKFRGGAALPWALRLPAFAVRQLGIERVEEADLPNQDPRSRLVKSEPLGAVDLGEARLPSGPRWPLH